MNTEDNTEALTAQAPQKIEDGGPAFPFTYWDTNGNGDPIPCGNEEGTTLRDYFAAKALQGILANSDCEFWEMEAKFAAMAYGHADAMIQARKAVTP